MKHLPEDETVMYIALVKKILLTVHHFLIEPLFNITGRNYILKWDKILENVKLQIPTDLLADSSQKHVHRFHWDHK